MKPARQSIRSTGVLAVCVLAVLTARISAAADSTGSPQGADTPFPTAEREALRARVTQGLATNNSRDAQLALMDWLRREPRNLQALQAQAELFETQGEDELAYAVIAHAISLAPEPVSTTGGIQPGGDPAAFAAAGETRNEMSLALWATYRRLQTKLYHPDEAPSGGRTATLPVGTDRRAVRSPGGPSGPALPEASVQSVSLASPTTTAKPATTPAAQPPASPSGASPPPAPAVAPASPEDAEFARDPRGQWAMKAEASSEYGDARWNAAQAAGAPDVAGYGDNDHAWASKLADAGEEWLKLTFATPVRATAVRVRQTLYPGAVAKVEVFSADGRSGVVWSGRDPTTYPRDQISWFVASFAAPPFPVQSVRLTLDSAAVYGWNEIDAVQLVGDP